MLSIATATVEIESVLIEIDGPQLLVARDLVGARYLCSLSKTGPDGDHFVAVQISSRRLQALRDGVIDVRSALVESEMGVQYHGVFGRADDSKPLIRLEAQPELSDALLPDAGILLTEYLEQPSDEAVVQDAIEKHAAVIVCRMNPPESRGHFSRVDADRLAHYISSFQMLVRQSARKASAAMAKAAKASLGEDPFGLQVFAFSGGSFRIHFEAKDFADLFGASVIGTAMKRVDEMTRLSNQTASEMEQALEPFRGAELAAYRTLLRLVDEQDVPFSYRWAEPALTRSLGEHITPVGARAMGAVLDAKKILTTETFEFVGRFTSVNTDRPPFSWVAHDDAGKPNRGFLHEAAPDVLDGVTIKATSYLFRGDLSLVSTNASPKPTFKKFLRSATPIE